MWSSWLQTEQWILSLGPVTVYKNPIILPLVYFQKSIIGPSEGHFSAWTVRHILTGSWALVKPPDGIAVLLSHQTLSLYWWDVVPAEILDGPVLLWWVGHTCMYRLLLPCFQDDMYLKSDMSQRVTQCNDPCEALDWSQMLTENVRSISTVIIRLCCCSVKREVSYLVGVSCWFNSAVSGVLGCIIGPGWFYRYLPRWLVL